MEMYNKWHKRYPISYSSKVFNVTSGLEIFYSGEGLSNKVEQILQKTNMKTMYYNKRDKNGKFSKVSELVGKSTKTKRLVNNIAILLDGSGSMEYCWSQAVQAVRDQITTMRQASKKMDQVTTLTVVDFAPVRTKVSDDVHSVAFDVFGSLNRNSNTPLNDGIMEAINQLKRYKAIEGSNDDTSYALIVITDGEENASKKYPLGSVKDQITKLQAEGNWTFAVNCPVGSKVSINRDYNIPIGNINEWENSIEGTMTMGHHTSVGTQSFYATRGVGGQSVSNFYTVDATNFNTNKLHKLTYCSPKHNKVDKEIGISEFFNSKNMPYVAGMAYYELTKPEKVQDYKKLILLDLDTNNYHVDNKNYTVREFLGMPTKGTTKVNPKNVGKFRIFVQSKSDNRKLVRGSTILWL